MVGKEPAIFPRYLVREALGSSYANPAAFIEDAPGQGTGSCRRKPSPTNAAGFCNTGTYAKPGRLGTSKIWRSFFRQAPYFERTRQVEPFSLRRYLNLAGDNVVDQGFAEFLEGSNLLLDVGNNSIDLGGFFVKIIDNF